MMFGGAVRILSRQGSIQFQQVAGAKRGPTRYFGKTKAQLLDGLMRSNANICFALTLSFFPICAYYTYRYFNVIRPARQELDRKAAEDLLAEGKAIS